ncbi:ABC transporter permease [Streptomyces sp. NBC_00690]|uniref:ABC transporter permease n=1 Tax=Streptomyces sp. NBC_00690 TaxID=2975808 RepID=UPI002E2D1EC1|nr:FtsX-like permease family protein [Streptomyces sp. NBC_00690]
MNDRLSGAGVRGWTQDLALGVRFAVTGGRRGWTRTLLTAFGVGLGVALLLVAAAIPHALQSRDDRSGDRTPAARNGEKLSASAFHHAQTETVFRDNVIAGTLFRAAGNGTPSAPPGLSAMPKPGEMAVSPALAELLASPGSSLLKERLPYRVTATIGDRGLIGPGELLYYAGSDKLTKENAKGTSEGFGRYAAEDPFVGVILLIVVIAFVALLLPVAVFIATAVRFGGEQRDRRLAALRLVGSDRAMTHRIAAGEALCGALLGLVAGAGLFFLARQFAGAVTLWDITAFPVDVVPHPVLAVLILAAVPVAAVAVSLFAMRGVSVEPLGVVRNSTPRRRKVWWRVLLPVLGILLLLSSASALTLTGDDSFQIALGAALTLVGITALLPWLVEAVVSRLDGGPVAWQLAVRRLQLSSGTAARAISGIVVAAAGAIALQMLFSSVQGDFTKATGVDTSRAQLHLQNGTKDGREARETLASLRENTGVAEVIGLTEGLIERPGPKLAGEEFVPFTRVVVADCTALRSLAKLPSCKDGDVFTIREPKGMETYTYQPKPGAKVELIRNDDAEVAGTEPHVWQLPATTKQVKSLVSPVGTHTSGVLATPAAINVDLLPAPRINAMIKLAPDVTDAAELVRNEAARLDPLASVSSLEGVETDRQFASVRTGLFVGATATMVLIAASLLVSTLEQLRERRRLLSILVAFGTRRSTLSWSVLWQTAVPIALGLALAVVGGSVLGLTLLFMVGSPVASWWVSVPIVGVGAALIALVTLLSMPPLWRMMRPDGLRTE